MADGVEEVCFIPCQGKCMGVFCFDHANRAFAHKWADLPGQQICKICEAPSDSEAERARLGN